MANKPTLLSPQDHARMLLELELMATRMRLISEFLGDAYGQSWFDKAQAVQRSMQALRSSVDARFYRQPIGATNTAPVRPPAAWGNKTEPRVTVVPLLGPIDNRREQPLGPHIIDSEGGQPVQTTGLSGDNTKDHILVGTDDPAAAAGGE